MFGFRNGIGMKILRIYFHSIFLMHFKYYIVYSECSDECIMYIVSIVVYVDCRMNLLIQICTVHMSPGLLGL